MNWFKNLKVATKLISAFILVSLIAGAMGAFGIFNMRNVDEDYSNLFAKYGITFGDMNSAGINFNNIRVKVSAIIMNEDPGVREQLVKEIAALDAEMKADLDKFEDSIQQDNVRELFKTLKTSLAQYEAVREKVVDLAFAGKEEEATAVLMSDGVKTANETNQYIEDLFEMRRSNGLAISKELSGQTHATTITMIVVVALMMAVSIGLGMFISRLISKPVAKLVESADQIADGDLNVVIDIDSEDEIGQLAASFRKMSDNLNEVMSNIQTAADQVATGAKQISEVSVTLSQGSTEQASSVEQLTSSTEEIASQTRQNADSSNEANKIADAARQNAIVGNNQMKEMLGAMEEINAASQNISKIIKVIDEIAFQTNILALNAAVEAARAGQHGKGFAVVAEEVRNLAARSANAAKETTELIEGSIKKVEGGTRIANETATALQQIVDDIAKVATIIGDIATASNEQAIGINQINQGIMQVSQVVQASSANLEETAATSEELASQADMLKEQVNRFNLRKGQTSSYQSMDDISPELLQLFEKMSAKKSRSQSGNNDVEQITKIDLSDNEFGKY